VTGRSGGGLGATAAESVLSELEERGGYRVSTLREFRL
jgi:hypothetical protein